MRSGGDNGPKPAADMMTQQSQSAVKHVDQKRFIKRYRTEVAASASSVLSTLATFPLDSVKTRMQTYKYSGFVDCVRLTYETEKLRGFFRGRSTTVSEHQPLGGIPHLVLTSHLALEKPYRS